MADLIPELQRILGNFEGIRLALLFGSRASGHATADSDIDLAILSNAPLSAEAKRAIIEAVANETGCAVDLVDLYCIPEPVTGEALKGTVIVGNDQTFAELVSRHLIDAADFVPIQERFLRERRQAWLNR